MQRSRQLGSQKRNLVAQMVASIVLPRKNADFANAAFARPPKEQEGKETGEQCEQNGRMAAIRFADIEKHVDEPRGGSGCAGIEE